jgi:hypothetical protein
MNNIKNSFDIVMSALKHRLGVDYLRYGNGIRPGPVPRFTDIEVIALSLTSEYLSIDSELDLFKQLKFSKEYFPNLISRRQYHDRRKSLKDKVESLRETIIKAFPETEKIYVIDSTPGRVCRIQRAKNNKMGLHPGEIKPTRDYCASQKEPYFGYKLHAICTPQGVIKDYHLDNKAFDERDYLKQLKIRQKYSNSTVVGDKGYINEELKRLLYDEFKLNLQYPYRSNQKGMPALPKDLAYKRRRIETVFSQLGDQFNLKRNLAKTFLSYTTRLISKICSYTIIQYINKFINNKPIGNLKNALI